MSTVPVLRKPEVLSPAGDWDCVRAAVENGADAVFFGVGRFNARVRAKNFTAEDLPELMAYLHRRGVRGYVTFNTLIFTEELEEAAQTLRAIIAAGVDAAIVQDIGICRLIRRLSPDFPIHASTQMTVTSAAGTGFARSLGASLAVLGREVSLPEMEKIQTEQQAAPQPLDLEVFVHGALCVAYSGQCLTSESLGGRSANRGECAQACRMPYELIVDGVRRDLGDRAYLLSPQDLEGVEAVPDLIRAGIKSLKIEGRLKSPGYVAAVTRAYRLAVDAAWAALMGSGDAQGAVQRVRREQDYPLQMAFSRGLHSGWLRGIDNQRLVHARFGKKRGVRLGEILAIEPPRLRVRLEAPAKAGDGVVLDDGRPGEREEGGFLHSVDPGPGGVATLRFGREALDWSRVAPGQIIWKTKDPELDRELEQTWNRPKPNHRRAIRATVHGAVGQPLRVAFIDEQGRVVAAESEMPCAVAEVRALDAEILRDQLGRLGETPFELLAVETHLEGALRLPSSELNRLRRDLADRLATQWESPQRWTVLPVDPAATRLATPPAPRARLNGEIIPVIRELAQLPAALSFKPSALYIELEDPKRLKEAVSQARAAGVEAWAVGPRIYKQGETWIIDQLLASQAEGFLVRNHEHLRAFAGQRRRGDFSLNVANPLAAEWLMVEHGLEGLTASYDLDARQLAALLRAAPPAWFEVTLHQHMPMFHMEHCVFCAFLTKGKDYRDCGRPCEKQRVTLRDRVGAEHLLKADAGCRNTLFNARAQTGAEFASELLGLGVGRFRVEFVDEDAATVTRTLNRYRDLLAGRVDGAQLWRELKIMNQLGVTRGTMAERGARSVEN